MVSPAPSASLIPGSPTPAPTHARTYTIKSGDTLSSIAAHFHTTAKILEQLKSELSEEIDRTVHTMQDEATVFADPNDRASQESDIALELRNRDRERKLIKKIDETIARTPVRRIGKPEDIAAACAFLVSEEAGYITGQLLGVNGGRNT